MHEMQTIVTNVRNVCPSVCLSRSSAVRDAFVQPLPNYFGILLFWDHGPLSLSLVDIHVMLRHGL